MWASILVSIAITPRIFNFLGWLWISRAGHGARTAQSRSFRILMIVLNVVALAIFATLFFMNQEEIEKTNKIAFLWLCFEMVSKVVEPIYLVIKIIMRSTVNKVHTLDDYKYEIAGDDHNQLEKLEVDHDSINHEGGHHEKLTEEEHGHEEGGHEQTVEKLREFEEEISDKKQLFLIHDFISMAAMCYVRHNVEHHWIVPAKRSQILWSAIWTQMMVTLMLGAMYHAFWINEGHAFDQVIPATFLLFLVKMPSI